MRLTEELRAKADRIASAGRRIKEEAHRLGASFSYADPARENIIIIEKPDGAVECRAVARPESHRHSAAS